MTSVAWALSLRKELRALSPALLAAVAVMAAIPVRQVNVVLAAYVFGALGVGALSVGHEYTYRTLSLALIRPVSRRAIMGAKIAAVTLALGVLVTVALVRLPHLAGVDVTVTEIAGHLRTDVRPTADIAILTALVLPLIGAVSVAPWLTMACRSTMAGIVFTAAVPAMVSLAASSALAMKFGAGAPLPLWAQMVPVQVLWVASLVLALVGTVAGWRKFMSLEAIDGQGATARLPRSLARTAPRVADSATRRRTAWWLLVLKELRLYQMPFVLAALFVVAYVGLRLVPMDPDVFDNLSVLLSGLYAVIAAVLVGSLACAEEHRLGTISWQVLLPVSARRQWAIKLGVVIVLSAVLGFLLPAFLARFADARDGLPMRLEVMGAVVMASCAAVYVSSVSRDGVRAMLTAPVVVAAGALLVPLLERIAVRTYYASVPTAEAILDRWAPTGFSIGTKASLSALYQQSWVWVLGVAIVLLLRFAFRNYRSGYPGMRGLVWQVGQAALWIVVATVMSNMVFALSQTSFYRKNAWCRDHPEECRLEYNRAHPDNPLRPRVPGAGQPR